jgi:hypothetical protein
VAGCATHGQSSGPNEILRPSRGRNCSGAAASVRRTDKPAPASPLASWSVWRLWVRVPAQRSVPSRAAPGRAARCTGASDGERELARAREQRRSAPSVVLGALARCRPASRHVREQPSCSRGQTLATDALLGRDAFAEGAPCTSLPAGGRRLLACTSAGPRLRISASGALYCAACRHEVLRASRACSVGTRGRRPAQWRNLGRHRGAPRGARTPDRSTARIFELRLARPRAALKQGSSQRTPCVSGHVHGGRGNASHLAGPPAPPADAGLGQGAAYQSRARSPRSRRPRPKQRRS